MLTQLTDALQVAGTFSRRRRRPRRLAASQTVGSLDRHRPPWILRGKSADLIQLPKLVFGECEFDRRKIVLKLVEAFRANDDRGYHGLS